MNYFCSLGQRSRKATEKPACQTPHRLRVIFQIFSREGWNYRHTVHKLGQEQSLCFLYTFTAWSRSNTSFEAGISGTICPISPSVKMQARVVQRALRFVLGALGVKEDHEAAALQELNMLISSSTSTKQKQRCN